MGVFNIFNEPHKRSDTARLTPVEIVEEVDMLVTAQTITLTEPFYLINRVVISFHFTGNLVDFDDFGLDNPLTNGISLVYKNKQIFSMQATHDLTHFSYDFNRLEDDVAAGGKGNVITTRYSFDRFGDGLDVLNHLDWLRIIIGDDLSGSANDELTFTFEGWTL